MTEKVAVITGSGDGLGKAIAQRLGNDGFRIVLSDINADTLKKTEAEFKAAGVPVTAFQGNVSRRDDQFLLVKHAVDTFGQVDVFVNNAGVEDVMPLDLLGIYCASKFSVRALTVAAAKELAPHRITVNAYCPGVAGTRMWDRIDEEMGKIHGWAPGEAFKRFSSGILMGRPQEPHDVASLVHYLASPDSDYMTGQAILIDGGMVFR